MFQLSKEQKISNIRELLQSKKRKVDNLKSEIKNLEQKLEEVERREDKTSIQKTIQEKNSGLKPHWSTNPRFSSEDEVPPSLRDQYSF
jgi:phage shock protein A